MKTDTLKDGGSLEIPHASEGIQADRVQEESKSNSLQRIGR